MLTTTNVIIEDNTDNINNNNNSNSTLATDTKTYEEEEQLSSTEQITTPIMSSDDEGDHIMSEFDKVVQNIGNSNTSTNNSNNTTPTTNPPTSLVTSPTPPIDGEYGCMTNKGIGGDRADQSTNPLLAGSIVDNSFTHSMNQVKMNMLAQSSAEDSSFVDKVKENLVEAAIKHTELESKKADYAGQTIDYESQILEAKQRATEHRVAEDKWYNREKRREYHYNGVKPIMEFVGIKSPMNLVMLYLLTLVLTPFYLLSKLFKGTIGALIVGAEDDNRSKQAKGFIWTMLGLTVALLLAAVIYLFLKWQGLITH